MNSQWPGRLPRSLKKSVLGLGVLLRNFWLWIFCSTKLHSQGKSVLGYIPVFVFSIKPGRPSSLMRIPVYKLNFMSECTIVCITQAFSILYTHVNHNEKIFFIFIFFFKILFQQMEPKSLKEIIMMIKVKNVQINVALFISKNHFVVCAILVILHR